MYQTLCNIHLERYIIPWSDQRKCVLFKVVVFFLIFFYQIDIAELVVDNAWWGGNCWNFLNRLSIINQSNSSKLAFFNHFNFLSLSELVETKFFPFLNMLITSFGHDRYLHRCVNKRAEVCINKERFVLITKMNTQRRT